MFLSRLTSGPALRPMVRRREIRLRRVDMRERSKTALVVSAHSADFVWRAGGAIAMHADKGYHVRVVCLSFGERGESAKLWKVDGITMEKMKADRRREA